MFDNDNWYNSTIQGGFMELIDLHIHTRLSDGIHTKEETINKVKEYNLKRIAITDHDILNENPSEQLIIPAVEMSSTYKNNGLFHILGYHIDVHNEQLKLLSKDHLTLEVNNCLSRDDYFMNEMSKKHRIDLEEYKRFDTFAKPLPGQQFISKAQEYLIHKGICMDRRDFFKKLYPEVFPDGMPMTPPTYSSPETVIQAIQSAGGIAILAHPFSKRQRLELNESLKLFSSLGIDGFECFHPKATKEEQENCLKWSLDNNYYISGGSDYHGDRYGRKLGIHNEYINIPL